MQTVDIYNCLIWK